MTAFPMGLAFRSAIPGLVFPPLPGARDAQLIALFLQLEQSQWLSSEQFKLQQARQLSALVNHCFHTVPYYRRLFDEAGISPETPLGSEAWGRLPLLTRRLIQDVGVELRSCAIPDGHESLRMNRSSGSTGEPIEVYHTGLDHMFWRAITLRDHAWHERDLSGKACVIRGGIKANPDGWDGPGWSDPPLLFPSGPLATLACDTDMSQQVAWLLKHDPHYLLTYPSNLRVLLDEFAVRGLRLGQLRSVETIGEVVDPSLRAKCLEVLGVPLVDVYSSQEVGYIALQCPVSGLYHTQSESLLVEVLDAEGRACEPGQTGRVVLTTLMNFAMPLLRYEIMDHAEVGPPCSCGRGLSTLSRIHGRTRNMITMPNGEQRWPMVGFADYRRVAPVRQFQIVQKSLDTMEMRLVVDRPLSEEEEAALTSILTRCLFHPFQVIFTYLSELKLGANGKYEDFKSELRIG